MSIEFWIVIIIIALFLLPITLGIIKSKLGTSNEFYGDEMDKEKNKRTKKEESYEKTTSASRSRDGW
ncbi:hypothetical protein [Pseudalkalibacillus decolorationis]|uniref:hypothetical protein n=1 Tax=Pseudalkalibacillus decolorationis TaxID=163879 RepID=UPI0021483EE4|nr:hypothetical protein [Pseudalkalibacillus decolorationis]